MSVKHFHHLGLTIPDVPVQKKFYEDFGLIGEETENRAILSCVGREQDQIILSEGPERKLHHVSYGTDEEGLAIVKKNIDLSDLATEIDCPKNMPYEGIWIKDFEDDVFNINVSESAPSKGGVTPSVPHQAFQANGPGHYNRVNQKGSLSYETKADPHRLGHIVQFTTSLDKKMAFYMDVMGLKLTDTCEGLIAFLRPPGGSDHHTVAFLETEKPGFHHASFEVDSVDHVGLGGQGMLEKGYRNGWGLGRHALGSNFFWYIRDPHDGLCEFFADIDYIANDDDWTANDWPMDVGFYLWGPNPPEEFGMNYEGCKTTTKPGVVDKGARN
jgi:catechol 2,3-dioxygenase-like lactoylglutathione lyase family enzyme